VLNTLAKMFGIGALGFGGGPSMLAIQMAPKGPWTELPEGYQPEGNVAIYCNKCSVKNRSDSGWRYRNNPEHAFNTLM
jgi:hypothetical protein